MLSDVCSHYNNLCRKRMICVLVIKFVPCTPGADLGGGEVMGLQPPKALETDRKQCTEVQIYSTVRAQSKVMRGNSTHALTLRFITQEFTPLIKRLWVINVLLLHCYNLIKQYPEKIFCSSDNRSTFDAATENCSTSYQKNFKIWALFLQLSNSKRYTPAETRQ